MARRLTPTDVHAIMNLLVREATGQDNAITVVDTSTFVSAGEMALATGVENTLNALSIVLGRTYMAVRPETARFMLINALDNDIYTTRIRKISFYSKEAEATGDWNTDLYTNFAEGYDNGTNGGASVGSMWEQRPSYPLEMNFAGISTWDIGLTIYENQLKQAFTSEADFIKFVDGVMVQKSNEITRTREAFNRGTVLNKIASIYAINKANATAMPGSVINLTKEFNDEYGTQHTSEELRTTYLKEFLEYFVYRFALESDMLTLPSTKYHWTPAKQDGAGNNLSLIRHTPYSRQKAFLYEPLFKQAKTKVLPSIFNPEYLDIKTQYEGVLYWQNLNDTAAIKVTPSVPGEALGGTATGDTKATEVAIPYVVGMLFDEDSIMTNFVMESADTSPLEARKKYRNCWWHFAKQGVNDSTENAIIFIMEDEVDNDAGEGGDSGEGGDTSET